MSDNTTTLQDVEDVGRRWAAALRRRYAGGDAAKRIARDFKVAPRTGEAWLAGQPPYVKYLMRGWRLFGAELIGEVLAPESDWHKAASVDAALGEVEARLGQLRDELVLLRGRG